MPSDNDFFNKYLRLVYLSNFAKKYNDAKGRKIYKSKPLYT